MKQRRRFSFVLFAAAVIAALFLATRRNLGEPHIRLFTEMVLSPASRSQTVNAVFRNGRTLQRPVEGTIPRGFTPLPYTASKAERARAGRELRNPVAPSFDALVRGKQVYETFCSHCHGRRGGGDGGVARAFPGFSYPITGKSTFDLPDGEIFHIISFGRNRMPGHAAQIRQADRWKAIHYLRDLQRLEKIRLGPLWESPEDPRRHYLVSAAYGKELFAENCAVCHGEEGRRPKPGTPALNAPVVLAVAGDDFYWDIINHGRKGSQMPAWKDILTKTQIRSVIAHLRSWNPGLADRGKVLNERGDRRRGKILYRSHCAACHGKKGQGGIGNSLNTPSFLALASDAFLRDTIVLGRGHTAMPSSYDLQAGDIADLIVFVRSWSPSRSTFAEVRVLLSSASARMGKKLFQARCAGCHGRKGKGGIGSRLNSNAFLRMVDDEFLYRGITEGRPGTAMPSWRHLSGEDVADLIKFIRTWQRSKPRRMSKKPVRGRPEFGKVLFNKNCVKCHAKEGAGDIGAQIGNPTFLSHVSDAFIKRTVLFGKKGTEMKGFKRKKRDPLNEEDVNHLIAYLRFLENRPRIDFDKRSYSWAMAEDGREIYEKTAGCAKCHGLSGEGASGPALGNPAFLRVASDGFIAGSVVLGREGTEMPSHYRGGNVKLEQEDIENVVAYIRGFEKRKSMPARRFPYSRSSVVEGGKLFARFCAGCHGSEGRGSRGNRVDGYAPALNNQEFLSAARDDLLLATIALGRPGTPMRAFAAGAGGIADLSAREMRLIVAFIRSWERSKK